MAVLSDSLAPLSVDAHGYEVICRSDSAAASHAFLDACRERHVRFVVGHPLTGEVASAVLRAPPPRWVPAISADGTEAIDWAEVAELSEFLDLSSWPKGTPAIARREIAHPGAQLTFTDADGRRYQLFLTDHASPDICFLEGLYPGRGRAECAIRDAKDSGLSNLPSASLALNAAWLALVMIAGDLFAWAKALLLCVEFHRAEPKRLRCLLHSSEVIVSSGRRRTLRLGLGWPWSEHLAAAFSRLARFRPVFRLRRRHRWGTGLIGHARESVPR